MISDGGSDFVRAAASSIASGKPSRRRHNSTSCARSVVNPGCTARARAVNRATASSSMSEPNATWSSPSRPSGSRLVATIRNRGHADSSRSTTPTTALRTCSQLSTTMTTARSAMRSTARSSRRDAEHVDHRTAPGPGRRRPRPPSRRPSWDQRPRPSRRIAPRSQRRHVRAYSSARRVFPTPAGTHHGDQPTPNSHTLQRVQLARPTDERRQRHRQRRLTSDRRQRHRRRQRRVV